MRWQMMERAQGKRMERARWVMAWVVLLAANPVVFGQPVRVGRPLVLQNCPVRPLADVTVPVNVAGVLRKVAVKKGNVVKKGELLAVVDDRLARMEVERKTVAAKNENAIFDARAKLEEAEAQLTESNQLFAQGAEPETKNRETRARRDIAKFAVDNAFVEKNLAAIDQQVAETQLSLHEVRAEFDGVIVDQLAQEGEAVQALDPVFRLMRTDIVRVEAALPLRDRGRVQVGMRLQVYPTAVVGDIARFVGHTDEVTAVVVLPGDQRVASASRDGTIRIWDLRTGREERAFTDQGSAAVLALAIHPQEPDLLLSGGADGMVVAWNTKEGRVVRRSGLRAGPILSLAVDAGRPDRCYTGHEDRLIRHFDLSKDAEIARFTGHTNFVTALQLTADGTRLFSTGADQTVRLWDTGTAKLIDTWSGRSPTVHRVALSKDGQSFLFNNGSFMQVRRLADGVSVESFENQAGAFTDAAEFAPDGDLVLTVGENRRLQLWEMSGATGHQRLVRTYEGHSDAVPALAFSSDGSFVVTGSVDRTVRVWPIPTQAEREQERKAGVLDFISQEIEAGSQTVAIATEIPNPEGVLRAGWFANLILYPDTAPVAAGDLPGINAIRRSR